MPDAARRATHRDPSPAALAPGLAIRPATEADRDAIARICVATGRDGEDASGYYDTPGLLAEIWALPYLAYPKAIGLVTEQDGEVTGYVLGVADTAAFDDWAARSWWPGLRAAHPLAPASPRDLPLLRQLHAAGTGAPRPWLRDYPAHLHIDLLPVTQGLGAGRLLIGAFVREAARRGAPGVHLGVSPANTRAIGFYRHLGFTELESAPGHLALGLTM